MSVLISRRSTIYKFSHKEIAKTRRKSEAGQIPADFFDCHPSLKKTEIQSAAAVLEHAIEEESASSSISYESSENQNQTSSQDDEEGQDQMEDEEEFDESMPLNVPTLHHASSLPSAPRRRVSLNSLKLDRHAMIPDNSIPVEPIERYTLDRLRKLYIDEHLEELELQKKKNMTKRVNQVLHWLDNDYLFFLSLLLILIVWTFIVVQILVHVPDSYVFAAGAGIISFTLCCIGTLLYFNQDVLDHILR